MAVSRIGYISLYVTDLEAARRHYVEVVGLRETDRDRAGRLYLQAADNQDHHCLVLTQAPKAGLDHVAFKVGEVEDLAEAKAAITARGIAVRGVPAGDVLGAGAFGKAGMRVVIEDVLVGEEASFICMVDGRHIVPLATSQDHKRVGDGDTGPNTGGMGAYSPAPVVDARTHERIMREVIEPTVRGMAEDGTPFTGFLYAGLMIDASGAPRVIEFNVRFGDPETQPILMRLRSDLLDLIEAALEQRLDPVRPVWDARPALAVVMAAAGYPGAVRTGDRISLPIESPAEDVKVFHAGTRSAADGATVVAGGRVLTVCALGDDLAAAAAAAYRTAADIRWPGAFYRHDIGWRALQR